MPRAHIRYLRSMASWLGSVALSSFLCSNRFSVGAWLKHSLLALRLNMSNSPPSIIFSLPRNPISRFNSSYHRPPNMFLQFSTFPVKGGLAPEFIRHAECHMQVRPPGIDFRANSSPSQPPSLLQQPPGRLCTRSNDSSTCSSWMQCGNCICKLVLYNKVYNIVNYEKCCKI